MIKERTGCRTFARNVKINENTLILSQSLTSCDQSETYSVVFHFDLGSLGLLWLSSNTSSVGELAGNYTVDG